MLRKSYIESCRKEFLIRSNGKFQGKVSIETVITARGT